MAEFFFKKSLESLLSRHGLGTVFAPRSKIGEVVLRVWNFNIKEVLLSFIFHNINLYPSDSKLVMISPLREHLEMSGDVFGCYTWGAGGWYLILESSVQRPRMLVKILQCTREPTTPRPPAKNYLAQKISRAKVVKPCLNPKHDWFYS